MQSEKASWTSERSPACRDLPQNHAMHCLKHFWNNVIVLRSPHLPPAHCRTLSHPTLTTRPCWRVPTGGPLVTSKNTCPLHLLQEHGLALQHLSAQLQRPCPYSSDPGRLFFQEKQRKMPVLWTRHPEVGDVLHIWGKVELNGARAFLEMVQWKHSHVEKKEKPLEEVFLSAAAERSVVPLP